MCSHRLFSLVVCVVLACASAAKAEPSQLVLGDGWDLRSGADLAAAGEALSLSGYSTEGWHRVAVPTTVLAALVEAGVFPDPYFDLNLKEIPGYRDAPWLVMPEDSPFRASWWFRTEFEAPAEWQGKFVQLHLDGINYQANVWLNGTLLADSETLVGMFRRFQLPVQEVLQAGATNALAIEIIPPGLIPDIEYRAKQIEATTGWDDHNPQPPDLNMGLWQQVSLKATGPVRLAHPYAESQLSLPDLDRADLQFSAFATNLSSEPVTCTVMAGCESIALKQDLTLAPGETKEVIFGVAQFPELSMEHPRVWWPHPLGKQELYSLEMAVAVDGSLSDQAATSFGIRDATTYVNDEDWRGYQINGQNILIRGGAWMTADMMLRLEEHRYDALVRYAREAHLNMLRSEGFSIRETNTFYDLCDHYGVMVTQQIFGRSIPDEALAIASIEDMLLRIRNHPSLVHLLGHDETFPTDTLDAAYQELIEKYRIQRTYQPHSGTFNVAERAKTGGTRTGTRELWTYASPAHYYLRKDDGAWGFAQSGGIGGILAAPDSLRQMIKPENLWPALGTEAWSFHTVTQGAEYFTEFQRAMEAGYGAPADLEDFSRKAYAMNYNSARGMYEAYARNKYDARGITTWKYNAAWPAALTWQYIDWYLRPTAAYYGAQKACAPLHIQYAHDDHGVYVVNSHYLAHAGLKASATIHDLHGAEHYRKEAEVAVGADGVAQAFVLDPPEDLPKTWFLKLMLEDPAGHVVSDNFYWLSTKPDIPGRSRYTPERQFYTEPESRADFTLLNELPRGVTVEQEIFGYLDGEEHVLHVTLRNTGNTVAFLLHLTATNGPGTSEIGPTFWSDNFFSLLPGESKTVTARLYTRDLGNAKPEVKVHAWNL